MKPMIRTGLLLAISALSSGGCKQDKAPGGHADPSSETDGIFVEPPVLVMSDNLNCPLVGAVRLTTAVPTTVVVAGTVGGDPWSRTFDTLQTEHDLTLLGFRADAEHEFRVTVVEEGGEPTEWDGALTAVTSPLPADFPAFEVLISEPDQMEPGLTVFNATFRESGRAEYGVVVDDKGHVVWFVTDPMGVGLFGRLDDGNMYYGSDRYGAAVVDMWGDVVEAWHTTFAPTHSPGSLLMESEFVHHDVIELPNGNLLTFGMELIFHPDYPTSEVFPNAPDAAALVATDLIVEFARDGSTVRETAATDLIDTTRIGFDSVTGNWWSAFLGESVMDWTHGNALFYDETDDTILASFRHQDAVVKFSRTTGELIWILAPNENWSPEFQPYLLTPTEPDFRYAYHQHGVKVTPDGTILMFDNGNNQASAFEDRTFGVDIASRAVEFAVDPAAMTLAKVWHWDDLPGPNFAIAQGDADVMPATNNVLITYGDLPELTPDTPSAHIVEVTRDASEEIVFHLEFATGARIYRSQRVDSLYPPAQAGF